MTRLPYLTEDLKGKYGRPCYQRSYCQCSIGDKRNPGVTSSDGHLGRLVGKR